LQENYSRNGKDPLLLKRCIIQVRYRLLRSKITLCKW
jgi:hypothetical protein